MPQRRGQQPSSPPAGPRPAAAVRDRLQERRIFLERYNAGQHRAVCPECNGGSSQERSLAVRIDANGVDAVWNCFRGTCGWTGGTSSSPQAQAPAAAGRRGPPASPPPQAAAGQQAAGSNKVQYHMAHRLAEGGVRDPGVLAFFRRRGIAAETLRPSIVRHERAPAPGAGGAAAPPTVAFVYTSGGRPANIKFRSLDTKRFWQVAGAEKLLYGLDDISPGAASGFDGTVIIVEGEMDKLSCDQAGMAYCVSVPDGAPRQVREGSLPETKEEDAKFEYVWNCRRQLDQASKIILATDNDGPGDALAEELARRLGRDRCWRVRFPTGRKDANEVLVRDGPAALRRCILEGAVPYPINGLLRFGEFEDEILSYYGCELSDARGASTGWADVDRVYRVVPGELTVVTGVPNSGKSEFLDALMVNLCAAEGWRFALCSMENKVRDHARKLLEKYCGSPFFDSPEYAAGQPRIPPERLRAGIRWLDEHFSLIRCDDEELPSVDWILSLARAAVMRQGIKGLVIDPYNELDHRRPSNMTETEYVSQMLSRVKRFAQMYEVHVWFVAHPRQMHQWRGEAPQLYDIAGSAHFINKCDNGLVVHRNRDAEQGPLDHITVHVRKVRNKAAGTIGEALLRYDRATGRYEDVVV